LPHLLLLTYKDYLTHEVKYVYLFYIYLFTAIGLLPGGSGYFTCKQNKWILHNAKY